MLKKLNFSVAIEEDEKGVIGVTMKIAEAGNDCSKEEFFQLPSDRHLATVVLGGRVKSKTLEEFVRIFC